MSKTITIKHVADRAGVSVGTVSRYLNGMTNVGEANATRVREAVDELGYRPSASARILATRRSGNTMRTGNIGVYFNQMSPAWSANETTEAYINGIEAACAEHGMHSLIEFGGSKSDTLPRFILDHKVDGFLITGIEPSAQWLEQVPEDIPLVGMGALHHDTPIPLVTPDNYAAGRQVAQHLWKMGHRRIAFVYNTVSNHMFVHRRQGVEEFLQLKGCFDPDLAPPIELQRDRQNIEPEASPPDMLPVLQRLLSLPEERRPTALVAPNDWNALGVYSALNVLGLTPGEDISVMGFDNFPSMCCSVTPALTSYDIPIKKSAYVAAKLLYQHITTDMSSFPRSVQLISGHLVERQSVKPHDMSKAMAEA